MELPLDTTNRLPALGALAVLALGSAHTQATIFDNLSPTGDFDCTAAYDITAAGDTAIGIIEITSAANLRLLELGLQGTGDIEIRIHESTHGQVVASTVVPPAPTDCLTLPPWNDIGLCLEPGFYLVECLSAGGNAAWHGNGAQAAGEVPTSTDGGHVDADLTAFLSEETQCATSNCSHTGGFLRRLVSGRMIRLVGPWATRGAPLSGSSGLPLLVANGPLSPGSSNAVFVTQARPLSSTFCIVGLSDISAPFKQGVLVPSPDIVIPLATGLEGAAQLPFTWPSDIPCGTILFHQV